MRKQDIREGVLYAWQESRTGGTPRPVRFLTSPAKDPLWKHQWGREDGERPVRPLYEPAAPGATRPRATHSSVGQDTGYPAVMARWNTDVRIGEALALLPEATLTRFGQVSDQLDGPLQWTLITDLRYITGLWEPVRAAWQAEKDRHAAAGQRRSDEQDARRAARRELQERLRAAGVQTTESGGQSTGFDMLLLSRFELEKLANRLEQDHERPTTPELITVMAVPSELMRAATGETLPVHTSDDRIVVELRIPTALEYRLILERARREVSEKRGGVQLPPMPSDAQIVRMLRPLDGRQG